MIECFTPGKISFFIKLPQFNRFLCPQKGQKAIEKKLN